MKGFSSMAVMGLSAFASVTLANRPIPSYTINLDLPFEERFSEVMRDFDAPLHTMWNYFFAPNTEGTALLDFMEAIALARGPEVSELEAELKVLADHFDKPLLGIRGLQTLYELQTLMVPVENITLPWRGPGCTGIIARDSQDNYVYHARNLDFSPLHIMQDLAYTAVFTRGGVEQYRYQTLAGYQLAVTGMKRGPNGYTIERNTRYTDHEGGNEEMIKALVVDKVDLNGWSIRKVFETCDTYECAVEMLSTVPFASTEYSIISGAQKGTIIARNPNNVAHTLELGKLDVDLTDPNYIIMTNFDFYFHDVREFFDPTGGRILRPRRVVAQSELAKLDAFTPDNLYGVINHEGVFAVDTIVQAVMSVEADLYNMSMPDFPAESESGWPHKSSKKYIERFYAIWANILSKN